MKKAILYIIILIIGGLFVACSEDRESCEQLEGQNTIVRIMATINTSNEGPAVRGAITRSGKVDDSNSDYQEGIEDGNSNENAVGTIRMIAFNTMHGGVVKNILYRLPGRSLGTGESHFAFDGVDTKIHLDMEIMSGIYRFVLITNEETVWNLASISSYSQLLSSAALSNFANPIIKVADLADKVSNDLGIPMIGEAIIKVLPDANATATNPQVVAPKIDLKRTIAKVEVLIRNTDDGTNVIETAKPYKIKSATLVNANQKYNLFEENNTAITEQFSNYVSNVTHTAGALFTKQNIFTGYLAERKNVTETNATTVRIVTEVSGDEYVYNIPLYQYEDAAKTKKSYDIHRNTIYRLGTKLVGKELEVEVSVNYTILDYIITTTSTTNYPSIVNLDRKILVQDLEATTGHLYYNFKSYDVDATSYMEYVKTTLYEKEGEELVAEIEQVEDGLFKYTIDIPQDDPSAWIYLHFKNNKIIGENNMIAIAILLYPFE